MLAEKNFITRPIVSDKRMSLMIDDCCSEISSDALVLSRTSLLAPIRKNPAYVKIKL